jgi:hypothetical protein
MIQLLFVAVMCPVGAVVGSAAIYDLGLIRCQIIHGLPYLLFGGHCGMYSDFIFSQNW